MDRYIPMVLLFIIVFLADTFHIWNRDELDYCKFFAGSNGDNSCLLFSVTLSVRIFNRKEF
jgi:hypothetical protein